MKSKLNVSLLQMQSRATHKPNIEKVREAAFKAKGQDILVLPEYSGLLNKNAKEVKDILLAKAADPFIEECKDLAKDNNLWIHIGSTPVKAGEKLFNKSALINSEGRVVADYNKLHMFDIYPEGRKPILESNHYQSGEKATLVETPWGYWGMTVCYDLRFPYLFRAYAQKGAKVIFVPSAFTLIAGDAHWEVLLRARAIETGCWIIAAAQVGLHEDGRETYGHSIIVDPWGKVVINLGNKSETQRNFEIDIDLVNTAHQKISSFKSDQAFNLEVINMG